MTPSPDSQEPPKILIVDDTPANLVALRHLLRKVKATVVEARSGNEALAACLDHEFALILLDVQMPDVDGFEVAGLLSEEARTRETPIIFVTAAYGDDLNRIKGYRHGAVDYIAKPVNDIILLSKVRIFLELYNSKRMLQGLLEVLGERNAQLEAEVRERKRLEELAKHQAGHDVLTGLPNRLLFMDRLAEAVKRAERSLDPLTLLYVDLDHFKPINDQLGHLAGDITLRAVAARLLGATRKSDTCARIGGDEFAVVLDGAGEVEARQVCEKLCEVLRQPIAIDLGGGDIRQVTIGASVGASVFPQYAPGQAEEFPVEQHIESLIRVADEAMYAAKRSGKNRSVVARPLKLDKIGD